VNNSKKLQTRKVKKDRLIEQKSITRISKLWVAISAILVIALVGGLLFDQYYEPTLLKVDGKSYKMSNLSYYFYSVEYQYDYYDQIFGGGGAYWDMTNNSATGQTVRDAAKDEAIQTALSTEVLYNQAVAEGYALTEDEKNTIDTNVDNLLSTQIPAEVIRKNSFSKAYLTKIVSRVTLADRYRKDKIATLNIDRDSIKASVKYEDFRQFDIQYLFISTKTTDEEGNSVDVSADEKSAAYDKIKGVFEAAKTTEDWSTLIPEDETQLTYQDTNFLKTSTSYSEDLKTMMMGMENGAVSEIFEDEKGYYIIRMADNDDKQSYDTEVQDQITKVENEGFSTLYKNNILPEHTYTINEKALKSYTMGTITLVN
jgi:foldase protein PrsA